LTRYDGNILSGVVEYCVTNGIRLLAYRPLGGRKSLARTTADETLNAVAARNAATPFEIALAWLDDLNEIVIPIPGVTRVETVASIARAHRIVLGEDDRQLLDQQFPSGPAVRAGTRSRTPARSLRSDAEVVMVMGLPAAGKTTLTETLVAEGYRRLNRDEAGGSLGSLIPELQRALANGATRIVLDNTYITRKSRAEVIRAAAARDVPVRCQWLSTSLDDAQVNAATRLVTKYGRLPDEAELAALRKRDVNVFPPSVLFRYQRELEPPDVSEGFSAIEQLAFERRKPAGHVNGAAIVWCDDPEKLVSLAPALRDYADAGRKLFGLSWQPAIAEGKRSSAEVEAMFGAARARMGLAIEFAFCPHGAGPPRCWCRKPLPGLGVLLIHRHQLDPAQCIYIGDGVQDPGFARRLGFVFRTAGVEAP
jgi:predicted kinase